MIVTFQGGNRTDGATGGDIFVGVIILLICVGWVCCALCDFFMLTKVSHQSLHSASVTDLMIFQIHGYYRATGASITKAQAEFTTNMFQNEAVRNAAASAAAAGVRQGFQQTTQGQQQAPRY